MSDGEKLEIRNMKDRDGDVEPSGKFSDYNSAVTYGGRQRPMLRVSKRFIAVKAFIALVLTVISAWTIYYGSDDYIYKGQCPWKTEPFGLCSFQSVAVVVSWMFILPLLSESLLLNMVFYAVITRGNMTSKSQQSTFEFYVNLARNAAPWMINFDEKEFQMDGNELLDWTLYKIERMSVFVKIVRHIKALIGVVFVIPLIFFWRSMFRIIQLLLTFPQLLTSARYRKEIREVWTALFVLPIVLLNDPLSIIILLPLSWVIIFSSQSFAETIVNVVAVQVFAKLDDEFVKLVFAPQIDLKETTKLYFPDYQPDPHYRPIDEDTASQV